MTEQQKIYKSGAWKWGFVTGFFIIGITAFFFHLNNDAVRRILDYKQTVYWVVENESDGLVPLYVADTPVEQQKGVSEWSRMVTYHDGVADEQGMIFEFNEYRYHSFWMKNVEFPLDMIWLDGNTIVYIEEHVQPEIGVPESQLQTYAPNVLANRVIEVSDGFVERYAIEVGDTVELILDEANLDL